VDLFITPVQLTCGHVFCRKCVSKWIYDHGNCPHCRGNAGMNNIVGINGLAQICTRVTRPPSLSPLFRSLFAVNLILMCAVCGIVFHT